MDRTQAEILIALFTIGFYAVVLGGGWYVMTTLVLPAWRNARRIREEARAPLVGPEGSPEIGRFIERHLAADEPILAAYSVTAFKNLVRPKWWLWGLLACLLFPPLLIVLTGALVLFVPVFIAWTVFYTAKQVRDAPAGGLGDLLVVQPGRVVILHGLRCDPKRRKYGAREVSVFPREAVEAVDAPLDHLIEGDLTRHTPHTILRLAGFEMMVQPFGGAGSQHLSRDLKFLPLDRLPPRFRDALRPFGELPATLAAWHAGTEEQVS